MRLSALSLLLLACSSNDDGPLAGREPLGPQVDPVEPEGIDPATIPTDRTRSGVLVPSGWPHRAFVADIDNGDVLIFSNGVDNGAAVPVGPEPTRMVRDATDLFVTLRASGEVVHLSDSGTGLTEVVRRHVGAEPFDVVVSADGTQLYVSLSMENAIVALDRTTLEERARWTVEGEPRWLAVTPGEGAGAGQIVAATFSGARLYTIDPVANTIDRAAVPMLRKFARRSCSSPYLFARITAEIVVDENWIYVPTLYVDTDLRAAASSPAPAAGDTGLVFPEVAPLSPEAGFDGRDPSNTLGDPNLSLIVRDDVPGGECGTSSEVVPIAGWGASVPVAQPSAIARFNPTLVMIPRTEDGELTRIAAGSVAFTDPGHDLNGRRVTARGPLSSLEIMGKPGEGWMASMTMENMGTMVTLDLDERLPLRSEELVNHARTSATAEAGPRGVRMMGGAQNELWVWSMLGRSNDNVALRTVKSAIRDGSDHLGYMSSVHRAGASELPEQVQEGRDLFMRSDLPLVTGPGSGVSCTVCHAEGRADGMTWISDDFARQTPVLGGSAGTTAPYTWLGDVPTVAMEAELTVTQRLGGRGLTPEQYAAIEAFVGTLRAPILPEPTEAQRAQIELGREVFNRAEVGCASCHSGEQGTNNSNVPLYGYRRLNVPQLTGIAASAPYLHDGTSASLRALLERSRDGSMGDTSSLTTEEMDALETFLRFF